MYCGYQKTDLLVYSHELYGFQRPPEEEEAVRSLERDVLGSLKGM